MVFGALPQGKLCICKKKIILRQVPISVREFGMNDDDIQQAADVFLNLWQENFRQWALEKELLLHGELAALIDIAVGAEDSDDPTS